MKKVICVLLLILSASSIFANVDETIGNIRLVIENYTGSISLYRKSSNENFTSLFDSKTFTKSPAFIAYYNGAVIPVNSSGGFKITSSVEDNTAIITAVLKNKVEIIINLDFFTTNKDGIIDSVKVTTAIKNVSDKPQEVALRAFFDTWLGENTVTHFSTPLRPQIIAETSFEDIATEKWIQSSRITDLVRFVIPESNIDSVVVANKNLLSQLHWVYVVQEGREFHSLNSYNNSALAITWNKAILDTEIINYSEFYILTGETSIHMPSTWPPSDEEVVVVEESPYDSLSSEDIQKIREILASIEALKADETYLNEQEILSLSNQVDAILLNAGR